MVCSLIGVCCVALGTSSESSDDDETTNTTYGIILTVISTVLYAFYEVSVKYFGDKYFDQRRIVQDTLYFQFMMGIWTIFSMWPFFLIFDWTGVEKFKWPNGSEEWLSVILPIVLDLIFTAAFFTGISLTNAVIVAMGTLLVIPVTFFADVIWHDYTITLSAVIGSLLIFMGFLLMEVPVVKYIRKKLGIRRTSIFFSGRNRRVAAMKRKSMQNQTYFEYYK